MKQIAIIGLCLICSFAFSQKTELDSLYYKLIKLPNDSQKVKVYHKLFSIYSTNNNDSALKYALESVKLSEKVNYIEGRISGLNNVGAIYYYQGKNSEALKNFLQSIKLTELYESSNSLNDFAKNQLSRAYNNIGTIYQRQKDYAKAESFFLKSINMDTLSNDRISAAHSYNNIGTIKEEVGSYDEAIANYNKALKIKIQEKDSLGIPSTLINIGVVEMNQNKFKQASDHFLEALSYCKKTNNIQDEALSLINLGDLYYLKKDYSGSVPYYLGGIDICKKQNYLQFLSYAYQSISLSYYKLKNLEKAYEYFQLHVNTKDSIYNKDNAKILHEMETKYESEKKEKEIKLLTADKELHQAELNKQRVVIYSSIGGLILITGFAAYVFYALNQKKKINRELDSKNQKIEHAYKIIDEKQKEILDSINYAKRIQYALLAHEAFLNKYLPENFFYFNPKDIVSGDFYWATNVVNKSNQELFYLACCDSTGHGVPGAFMSLLSIGFLSEAIKEKDIFEPNKVFNYVRKRLIESISNDQQKDGFDGILMCFNRTTGEITYAAANNKPILVSTKDEVVLKEFPCDKMPVGKADHLKDFNLFSLDYSKGDVLYLYTDGYADQFGGPKGKKFKYKPLNEMLLSNYNKPLEEQSRTLKSTFENWKGSLEQIDDVCVIGIRI